MGKTIGRIKENMRRGVSKSNVSNTTIEQRTEIIQDGNKRHKEQGKGTEMKIFLDGYLRQLIMITNLRKGK